MQYFVGVIVGFTMWTGAAPALAHVNSINLFVDASNKLFVLETFALPQMQEYLGIEISTDGPGLAVNFPTQGVAVGSSLEVDIGHDLYYWNGFGLAATDAVFEWNEAGFDSQGNEIVSPVSRYHVSSTSGKQTGMTWGTYNGDSFWEAHGLNFLLDLDSAPGIYGVVLEVRSSVHQAADPFVIPFVFDPNDAWDTAAEMAGAERLRMATAAAKIADLNDDGHVDTTDIDLLSAEIVAGTNVPHFDLTGDGMVDVADLAAWRLQGGIATLPSPVAYLPGDANLDGVVDVTDLAIWNRAKFTSAAGWSQGDFNADGSVDVSDFAAWNGFRFQQPSGLQSVPEPATATILLLGFLWVLGGCRTSRFNRQR